jgi:hypothetical protein
MARKEIQAGAEGNPRKTGSKSKLNPSISFTESSLFKGLHRPPTVFFPRPIPASDSAAKRQSRRRLFAPKLFVGPSVFVFGSSGCLSKSMKGWRLFRSRTLGAVSTRPVGSEASRARKGNPASTAYPRAMSPEPRTSRKKTGRSIRRPARIRPLHPARSGVELGKRTGASPSCLKSISRPLPSKTYPFRFAHARRTRPLFRRARRERLSPSDGSQLHDSECLQKQLPKNDQIWLI